MEMLSSFLYVIFSRVQFLARIILVTGWLSASATGSSTREPSALLLLPGAEMKFERFDAPEQASIFK
jgi:hypothetical protein